MDKIFDYFQTQVPESFHQAQPRLNFLLSQLNPGDVVLNIGLGDGYFEVAAKNKGIEIYTLDPSQASIDRIKPLLGERALCGLSQNMPFADHFFDAVVMSEVLEHLTDDVIQASLSEIKRVLKPQGRFMGTVPADENLKDLEVICPDCSKVFHRWGHLQSFSKNRLTILLQSLFSIEEISHQLFIHWPSLNWKGKILGLLRLLCHQLGMTGSGKNLYFKVLAK